MFFEPLIRESGEITDSVVEVLTELIECGGEGGGCGRGDDEERFGWGDGGGDGIGGGGFGGLEVYRCVGAADGGGLDGGAARALGAIAEPVAGGDIGGRGNGFVMEGQGGFQKRGDAGGGAGVSELRLGVGA